MNPWRVESSPGDARRSHWPRIAIVHSFYRSDVPSGENDTVRRQFSLLRDAGAEVSLVSVSTDELISRAGYLGRAAITTAFGLGPSPLSPLAEIRPQVVHVHNLFPNIGTGWLKELRAGLVVSLHNYRPMCAAATLSREGRDCTECLDLGTWSAVRHGCYRGSRVATVPLAWRTRRGAVHDPLLRRADVVLAPSPTLAEVYERVGVERVRTLYQPIDRWPGSGNLKDRVRAGLFIGRLTPEKGILPLLDSWPSGEALVVVGAGELEDRARRLANLRGLDVSFRGFVTDAERDELMATCEYLVFPSVWREGAPAVYAEALAFGLPIVAIAGNAVADRVSADGTGRVVSAWRPSDWSEAIGHVRAEGPALRESCESLARGRYGAASWLRAISRVYGEVAVDYTRA